MRKAVSLLFFIFFLVSLPGLLAGFRTAPNVSFLIGQIIFTLIMLTLAVYFWKPAPVKNKK